MIVMITECLYSIFGFSLSQVDIFKICFYCFGFKVFCESDPTILCRYEMISPFKTIIWIISDKMDLKIFNLVSPYIIYKLLCKPS